MITTTSTPVTSENYKNEVVTKATAATKTVIEFLPPRKSVEMTQKPEVTTLKSKQEGDLTQKPVLKI